MGVISDLVGEPCAACGKLPGQMHRDGCAVAVPELCGRCGEPLAGVSVLRDVTRTHLVCPRDQLVDRAEALVRKVSDSVSFCHETGTHPRQETISLHAFGELVELVRDLAKAVAQR